MVPPPPPEIEASPPLCPPKPKTGNASLRGCFNITTRQQVILITIIFIIVQAEQCPYYILFRLNAAKVMKLFGRKILRETKDELKKYDEIAPAVEIWSLILLIHTVITIIAGFALLFGAAYRKYEVVKSWIIFMALHYTLGFLLEVIIFFYVERFFLTWPMIIYFPVVLGMMYQCSELMRDLKHEQWERDHNPVKSKTVKPREVYKKGVVRAEKEEVESFDPNQNQSNYILA